MTEKVQAQFEQLKKYYNDNINPNIKKFLPEGLWVFCSNKFAKCIIDQELSIKTNPFNLYMKWIIHVECWGRKSE